MHLFPLAAIKQVAGMEGRVSLNKQLDTMRLYRLAVIAKIMRSAAPKTLKVPI